MRHWIASALALLTSAMHAADFTLVADKTDGEARVVTLQSPYQSEPTALRILAPPDSEKAETRRIVFILPVEAKLERRYGDGFEEARRLKLHTQYGVLVVAPSFSHLPWYADHPTNEGMRQETYFLKAVLPAVDQLYPAKRTRRLLLGFSKSGWGAFSLILRHPDLFEAASAWDAPLMKDKPNEFGMNTVFATQENFEKFQITKLLREKGKPFQDSKRLVLTGYGNFRQHAQDAHALLDSLGIQHLYADGPQRKHVWESGWVAESMKSLDDLTP